MRIGIDANPLFRTRAGVGQYAACLAERMSAVSPGDEFFLYHWTDADGTEEEWLRRENVVVRRVPKLFLKSKVRGDGIDVFHGTNFRCRARGRRGSVLTIHDLALRIFPELRRRGLVDRFAFLKTQRDAWLADRVIADSKTTEEDVVRHIGIPRAKVRTIALAPGPEFRPLPDDGTLAAVLARVGFHRPRYILFSGTLEPRKNVLTLLEAYLGLRDEFPDVGVILAGAAGWRSERTLEFIRLSGLSDAMRITGYLPGKELAALYSGASVFVLPSLYEGFGLTPLEAMACGAPVIVSSGGALPEVVGDAAVVLPPDDVPAFRREIARVLSDPALAEVLREKGFARASLYSWDRTAKETLAVYGELSAR